MRRFRKRPVEILAEQFNGYLENVTYVCGVGANQILREIHEHNIGVESFGNDANGELVRLKIPTLEGTMTANPGDWIIVGIRGEVYPCKPEIFDRTYDLCEGLE